MVVQTAEAMHPDRPVRSLVFSDAYLLAVAFDPLREPATNRVPDPFSWSPSEGGHDQVYAFAALQDARDALRRALAEGELGAVGQDAEGELSHVPPGFWRTDQGGTMLRFPGRGERFSQVFFTTREAVRWIGDRGYQTAEDETVGDQHQPQASNRKEREAIEWSSAKMAARDLLFEQGKKSAFGAAQSRFGSGLTWTGWNNRVWPAAIAKSGREDLSRPGRRSQSKPNQPA